MQRITSLIFLWVCLFTSPLSGQAEGYPDLFRNRVTLTFGLHQGYFRDRNFSPLRYRAQGIRIGLGYERRTDAGHQFGIDLNAGLLTLKTDVADYLTSDRYALDFSVKYLRRVGYNSAGRALHLGGKYRSYVDLALYDESEAVTFFAFHGLEAAGAASWRPAARHQLRAAASLPVFGLLVRPPHTGWDKFIVDNSSNIPKILTRGEWTSLNAFSGFRLDLGWQYQLGDHWWVGAGYQMAYYRTNRLDPIRILNNQYLISLTRQY